MENQPFLWKINHFCGKFICGKFVCEKFAGFVKYSTLLSGATAVKKRNVFTIAMNISI